jgi:hypothetical protein
VIGGLWTALNYPVAFLIALAIFSLLAIWLLPKLGRGIKRVVQSIARLFGYRPQQETSSGGEGS